MNNDITQKVIRALSQLVALLYGTNCDHKVETELRMHTDGVYFQMQVFRRDMSHEWCWEESSEHSSSILGACRSLCVSLMDRANIISTHSLEMQVQVFNLYHELFDMLGKGSMTVTDVIAAGPSKEESTHLAAGERILVVKAVRKRLSLGLKEAKDVMEAWEAA